MFDHIHAWLVTVDHKKLGLMYIMATYRNPFVRPWDGDTGNIPCRARRISADKFHIFAINCTHLGCPVRWLTSRRLRLQPQASRRSSHQFSRCHSLECREVSHQLIQFGVLEIHRGHQYSRFKLVG
jgi:Rieske Fe-S protein